MHITEQQAEDIIREEIIEELNLELVECKIDPDTRRWVTGYNFVAKDTITGKHYMGNWDCANTEEQEDNFYEQDLVEVELKEVVTQQWCKV